MHFCRVSYTLYPKVNTIISMDEEIKKYEISVLLRAEESAEEVLQHLKRLGAEVVEHSAPAKVKLAYPIKKETTAYFMCVIFSAAPETVVGLQKETLLLPQVLRFLIVTPPIAKMVERERNSYPAKPKPEEPKEQAPEPVKVSAEPEVLTNELLEKKLEEILK